MASRRSLNPKDKPQVKARLRKARERLAAAHEAKDKVKARHARRAIRLAKRDLRRIARIAAAEAKAAAEAEQAEA
ncbi:MAG: hypothetical protein D6739_06140 [Nitrospirae bacterium]|nr:MAG: hypothetical protein D6739_06140 [Nitrospirota bacterium]